jgi:hypothetical protein
MPSETFPVQSRRFERAKKAQTAQHILGACFLIMAAHAHLTDPLSHHVVLPALEILAGLTLIGAAVYDKFRKTHAHVGWVELAGAAMMFVEAIAKLQQPHHLLFHVLSFVPPAILLLFGLFEERLRKRPYIGVTDDAFEMRLRLLFKRRIPWAGLTGYRITPRHLALIHENGRVRKFKISDIENREAAMAWAAEQFERRGLSK